MSKIEAVIGGKQKGLADQVTIDPAIGCKNQCVGCYAKKSCQRGSKYDSVVNKDLDKTFLTKSIRHVKTKGFQLARVGKHCDPGDHIDSLNGILDCCNDEHFRCICVSKSLPFDRYIAERLRTGKHVLHMSLGPFSVVAPLEENIIDTAKQYSESGVRTAIRLTRDVTQSPGVLDLRAFTSFSCIVTPMRYASMALLRFYHADPGKFEFVSGYYRPKEVHEVWQQHMKFICGEINNEIKCCNCLSE